MTVWSDPSALTPVAWMVAGQFLVYAIGWLVCGLLLRGERGNGAGIGYWAAFMFFIGLGFWLVAQRTEPRTWEAFVGSSIAFVAASTCLWRGLTVFARIPGLALEQGLTLAALVGLLIVAGPEPSGAPWRVVLSYGSQAWLIGRAAWLVYPVLSREFGRQASWVMLLLPGAIVAVSLVLVAVQWHRWPQAMEVHRFDTVNPASMMVYVVLAAIFNFVFTGLLTTRLIRQLREQSQRDALTGLDNRRALDDRLKEIWNLHQRGQLAFSVLVIDIDHFKRINDRLGHHGGDEVLIQTARRLSAAAREGDTVARFGGEEFVVLMPGTTREGARAAAERLHAAMRARPFEVAGHAVPVTVSVGVAEAGAMDRNAEDCIRRADRALYEAKAAGRDRFVVAD